MKTHNKIHNKIHNKTHNKTFIEEMDSRGRMKIILLSMVLLQQILGSMTFPIAKYGLAFIEPFTFAFYRYMLSAVVLLSIVHLRPRTPAISKKDRLKILGLGVLIIPFNQTAYLYGQKLTGAGHAALLFATVPIWIFLGGVVILKEKFMGRRALGVLMGLTGVVIIMAGGSVQVGGQYLLGDLVIMISVLSWCAYTVLGKPLVIKYGALRVTAYALASGTAIYFPFGLHRALTFDYSSAPPGAWLTVVYVALGVSVAAYVIWYWLLKYMEATRIAVFQNLQPILASTAAFAFLGEPITWPFVAGGVVVLIGVFITEKRF